jgi:hypothetical protein
VIKVRSDIVCDVTLAGRDSMADQSGDLRIRIPREDTLPGCALLTNQRIAVDVAPHNLQNNNSGEIKHL